MKRLLNYMMFIGIAIAAISCAEPEEPTASQQIVGTWVVSEYYVSGQSGGTNIIEKLVIERDENFIMEDDNGVLTVGQWSADDAALTLTPTEGSAITLSIVTLTRDKGHFIQNLSSPVIGDVEIRYLMNNLGERDYGFNPNNSDEFLD
ncbi:lipocalin family protein [Marivirga sp.]|uniref:lipocalin family protein n=1 Tax=Marivirga sp. TaxID=2018662 RepID=UPI002D7E3670|nr:lipocalin family protein [Marivirga sp.]HET8858940.1 lipocalin family protein [Marivirga sp.]